MRCTVMVCCCVFFCFFFEDETDTPSALATVKSNTMLALAHKRPGKGKLLVFIPKEKKKKHKSLRVV